MEIREPDKGAKFGDQWGAYGVLSVRWWRHGPHRGRRGPAVKARQGEHERPM